MQGLAGVDVTVAAGACQTVEQPITFDATSWGFSDKIQLTAWAQDPAATGPAQVYQATQELWPFADPAAIFDDDFEDGTPGAWSAVVP